MNRTIKFNAWIKKAEIIIKDVAIYPGGAIGCEVNKIIEILDNKFEGQVYYDDQRQSIEFGNDDYFIEVLPCEGEWVNIPAEEVVILQSTGLFDKNGTEIFEGDILQRHMKGGNPYKKLRVVDYWAFWNKSTFRNLEFAWESVVVGNIFENPELLK